MTSCRVPLQQGSHTDGIYSLSFKGKINLSSKLLFISCLGRCDEGRNFYAPFPETPQARLRWSVQNRALARRTVWSPLWLCLVHSYGEKDCTRPSHSTFVLPRKTPVAKHLTELRISINRIQVWTFGKESDSLWRPDKGIVWCGQHRRPESVEVCKGLRWSVHFPLFLSFRVLKRKKCTIG